jgi:peptidoglycan/xylan/chitin deacetylase (PgdA/CDA1 family)
VVDTSNTKDSGSINLTGNAVPAFMRNTGKSIDLTQYTGASLLVYVPDPAVVSKLTVYMANDVNLTNYASFVFNGYSFIKGWNEVRFGFEQLKKFASFSLTKPVTTLQLRLDPVTGKNATVYLDSFNMVKASRANFLFTMDDQWSSQYEVAYPILEKYGFKGNIAVIPSKVGNTNYMNINQLNEVYSAGWDLMNHTNTHIRLGEATKATQLKELSTAKEYLDTEGFRRASNTVAYPYGSYNNDTLAVLSEQGYKYARTVVDAIETSPLYSPYEAKCINLTPNITVEEVKGYIDSAIATGGTIFFLNHRFGDPVANNNDSMFYDPVKYEAIVSYIKEKQLAYEANVITVSQFLNQDGWLATDEVVEIPFLTESGGTFYSPTIDVTECHATTLRLFTTEDETQITIHVSNDGLSWTILETMDLSPNTMVYHDLVLHSNFIRVLSNNKVEAVLTIGKGGN